MALPTIRYSPLLLSMIAFNRTYSNVFAPRQLYGFFKDVIVLSVTVDV